MSGKKIFINGTGCISPQPTFNNEKFLEELVECKGEYLSSFEPEYKEYISPVRLRRMSRIVKMGVSAAFIALKDAGVEKPDAIIAGTGWGCLEDTEKFLTDTIINKEQMLAPTAFIQSTHNTVSAQIALLLNCNSYNFTYAHRGFSFESSLLDAMVQLQDGEVQNALVGGVDEVTPNYFKITKRTGWWKQEQTSSLQLLESKTTGTIAGEGAAFFMLTAENNPRNYAEIRNLTTFYKPENHAAVDAKIESALSESGISLDEIDLVIFGMNGDVEQDEIYRSLSQNMFNKKSTACFKHLCGEYYTAGSFGLWLAAKILKTQSIPETLKRNDKNPAAVRNILLYNHYGSSNHAVYLLSKC